MDTKNQIGGRIKVLPPHVARKIAAGEVIERPQSVVRELIDNAIDAGSKSISLWLRGGGVEEILIIDDGHGMNAQDLHQCHLPHATSKIESEDDLQRIHSLGFRGEALAAIASVSRLEIQSAINGSAHRLNVEAGVELGVFPCGLDRGTLIKVSDLFYNLPPRRHFMKRSATEFSLCQVALVEKALSHPQISFKLFHEQELRQNLPACQGESAYIERLWQVYHKDLQNKKFIHEVQGSLDGASIRLIVGNPDLYRHDRKYLQIFINGRRIQDYGLVQALEYGYQGYLPGGRYPIIFAWLSVDPQLLDVNIHPAKREVKLHNHGEIHHRLVELIQQHLRQISLKIPKADFYLPPQALKQENFDSFLSSHGTEYIKQQPSSPISNNMYPQKPQKQAQHQPATLSSAFSRANTGQAMHEPKVNNEGTVEHRHKAPINYLGKIFDCFLLFTLHDDFYVMDMHAAHERILFNLFLQKSSSQTLLVPHLFTVHEVADVWLNREKEHLSELGFQLDKQQDSWQLRGCPVWLGESIDDFMNFLEKPHGEGFEALRAVAAQASCRKAIKSGDNIDDERAEKLIQEALELPDPRCPHGRPIWYVLSKEDLLTLIGRHI